MEEKLKAPDSQTGDSEVRLFQRCQELQALVQEKEDAITQLEQQLEEQVKHVRLKNSATGWCFLFFFFFKVQYNIENSPSFGVKRSSSGCRQSRLESFSHALGMWIIILPCYVAIKA